MQKLKNWLENEEVGNGPGTGLRVGGVNAGQGQWEGRHGRKERTCILVTRPE